MTERRLGIQSSLSLALLCEAKMRYRRERHCSQNGIVARANWRLSEHRCRYRNAIWHGIFASGVKAASGMRINLAHGSSQNNSRRLRAATKALAQPGIIIVSNSCVVDNVMKSVRGRPAERCMVPGKSPK